MNVIRIEYRKLSYEALAKLIELANELEVSPEEAARRWLLKAARVPEKKLEMQLTG